MNRPTYKALADLPLAERAARMRRPEVRDQILGEVDEFTGGLGSMMGAMLGRAVGRLFSLAFPVDYEPDPSQSVKALARAQGVEPLELPLRPHDRGRRRRRSSRCSATTSTTARSSRAGRCSSTRTR